MSSSEAPQALQKVIVALDYDDPEKAFRLVDQIGDLIDWFKIGPMLFTQHGADVVRYLHRQQKKVFIDLKLHDTPVVVTDTIKQIADMGASFATVHCLGGRAMLEAAGSSCRGSQLKLIGITLLTSHSPNDSQMFGWNSTPDQIVLRCVEVALETRLAGVMCSPHELAVIRQRGVPGFLTVTPGIRLPGKEVFQDDQQRFASPKEALSWGSDFLVIGRPITQAREPRDVVTHLFE